MTFNNNNETYDMIKKILPNIESIQPIGNHELKRHLVYRVKTKDRDLVIKFYYVDNRWNRDVSAFKILQKSSVMLPDFNNCGIIDGVEWLLYEYTEGMLLDQTLDMIDRDVLIEIYRQAGIQLALIHINSNFKYFGELNENLDYLTRHKTFKEYFNKEIQRVIKNVDKFYHEDSRLIEKAKRLLLEEINILDDIKIEPRLCHNDFSSRNIIVTEVKESYNLKCIIDFEQSSISDIDRELLFVYKRFCENDKELINAFKLGYEKYNSIDDKRIESKDKLYELFRGLSICGWAKEVDPNHYNDGIDILKDYVNQK